MPALSRDFQEAYESRFAFKLFFPRSEKVPINILGWLPSDLGSWLSTNIQFGIVMLFLLLYLSIFCKSSVPNKVMLAPSFKTIPNTHNLEKMQTSDGKFTGALSSYLLVIQMCLMWFPTAMCFASRVGHFNQEGSFLALTDKTTIHKKT